MSEPNFIPLGETFDPGLPAEQAAREFYERMKIRRSVRHFSDRPVPRETIEWLIRAAGTAPNGANLQPWTFVCIKDRETKRKIRDAAEHEERLFYEQRASDSWLEDLEPLGTDANKEYLEIAPWLIVVFRHTRRADGKNVYYSHESVGISVGMLITAAHLAGLVTLTHTPAPMSFLQKLLGRPTYERPYVLMPVGYPAEACEIPKHAIRKKDLADIMIVPDDA